MPPVGLEPTIAAGERPVVDLRLKPRGQWDRQYLFTIYFKYTCVYVQVALEFFISSALVSLLYFASSLTNFYNFK
jgi:hypothetical protein